MSEQEKMAKLLKEQFGGVFSTSEKSWLSIAKTILSRMNEKIAA